MYAKGVIKGVSEGRRGAPKKFLSLECSKNPLCMLRGVSEGSRGPLKIFLTHCVSVHSSVYLMGCLKKVYSKLDNLERCGFSHGIQHVAINTHEVFFNIEKFWPFLLYFMGIFKRKKNS